MTDHQTFGRRIWPPTSDSSSPNQLPVLSSTALVGEYDNMKDWGNCGRNDVTNYGQMTAGGWMYIGLKVSMVLSTPLTLRA